MFLPLTPCQTQHAAKAIAAVISPGTHAANSSYHYSSLCELGLFLQLFCQIPPSLSMCAWCAAGRDTAPGSQQHSAWLGHQLCVKIASVLYGIGRAVVPGGKSSFEQRRTQVTSQHRSLWQSDWEWGQSPPWQSSHTPSLHHYQVS